MEKKFQELTLDAIDRQLLELLQENAKYTNKELAGKLGLTVTPIYERVKRLEKEGYIAKYVALLDRSKVEKGLMALCRLSLKAHTREALSAFESSIVRLKEVQECFHISGSSDYLLKICTADMEAYHHFVMHTLVNIPGIINLNSEFVMHEIKNTTSYPLR